MISGQNLSLSAVTSFKTAMTESGVEPFASTLRRVSARMRAVVKSSNTSRPHSTAGNQ
jgi:hypothetical protein